jgi:hypothetical protein
LRRNTAVVGLVLLISVLTSGCVPILLHPTPGSSNSCPQGSWTLDSESVATQLSTFLGNATITPSGAGVQLVVDNGNGWTLTADQTVHVVVASPPIDATATVKGTVTGTYTVSGSTLNFTVTNVTGTAQYSGSVFGHAVSGSVSLPSLGNAAKLWALSGSASFTCGSSGDLALTFPAFGMHLHHK